MFSEESKPIGDAPRPPFAILRHALKETLYEVKRYLAKKREEGAPLPALKALAEIRHAFNVVFIADKRYFPEAQHKELDVLRQRIGSAIFAVEQLIQNASIAWLQQAPRDERFALDHVKLNLDAILADAQNRFDVTPPDRT